MPVQVGPKRPAHRRHRPSGVDQTPLAESGTRLQSVTSEPSGEKPTRSRGGVPQLPHAALGEVVDLAGPDLADPGVPRSIAVGEKGDELSVARNGGVVLGALEIRQPRDLRAFERIPPEVLRALQLPRDARLRWQSPDPRRRPPGQRRDAVRRSRLACPGATASARERAERFLDFEARVADVAQAALRILLETALQQSPDARRRLRGQSAPVGLALEDRRDRVGDRLARETPAGRSASRTARSRTPRCRCACRPPCPRACSGLM